MSDRRPQHLQPSIGAWPFAAGLIGLGGVGLTFLKFALQWQPVPSSFADWLPGIVASAGALIIIGCSLLSRRTMVAGGLAAGFVFAIWVVALHLPRVAAEPSSVVAWLGVAEILALSCAGFLWGLLHSGRLHRARRGLVVLFGLCALTFGLSHFVYASFTAMLVPDWLPGRLFWAYATGLAHVLAGLALIIGRADRLAAGLLSAMCASFVLLVHLPRVVAEPSAHAEWTALMIATCLAGSAWIVRSVLESANTVANVRE